jgi:hypothetical protein
VKRKSRFLNKPTKLNDYFVKNTNLEQSGADYLDFEIHGPLAKKPIFRKADDFSQKKLKNIAFLGSCFLNYS